MVQLSKEQQLELMFNQLYGGFKGMDKRAYLDQQKGNLTPEELEKMKSMNDGDWGALDDFRKQMGAIKVKLRNKEALTPEEESLVRKSYDALKDNTLKGINAELEESLASNSNPDNKETSGGPGSTPPPDSSLGGAGDLLLDETGEGADAQNGGGVANGGAGAPGTGAGNPGTGIPGGGAPAPDTTGTPFDQDLVSFDSFLGGMEEQLNAVRGRIAASASTSNADSAFDKQLESALGTLVDQLKAVNNKDPKKAKEAAKAIDSEIKTVLKTMKDLHAQEVREQKDELAIEKQRLDLLDKIQKLQFSWMKQAIDIQVKAAQGDAKISKAEYDEAKYDRKKLEELFITQFAYEAGETYKTGQDAKQAGNRAKEASAESREAKADLSIAETEAKIPYAGLAGDAYYFKQEAEIAGSVDRRDRYAEQDIDKIAKEGQKIGGTILGRGNEDLLGGYGRVMANDIGFETASRYRQRAEKEYERRQGFYDRVASRRRAPRGGNA